MRQLKFHERKLLKKVDFLQWKSENNHRELEVSLRSSFAAPSGWLFASLEAILSSFADCRSCGAITYKGETITRSIASSVEW